MSDLAVTRVVERVELDANAVLKRAWALYKRLFVRSVTLGLIIFGVLRLVEALVRGHRAGVGVALFTVVLSITGLALLQGALVEIVRGLHEDGDDNPSVPEVLHRSAQRTGRLVLVSLLAGFGIVIGFLLLIVPGAILAVRWALAVPVAMLEDRSAAKSLKRSSEIVRGNGWNVFKVLFAVGLLEGIASLPFTIASVGAGPFRWWFVMTAASALTAPYAAHALTVMYYGLVEPKRPVVLEQGKRWQSVWDAADSSHDPADS
jgi:hypothetical protein